jgi:hypothetical protein
MALSRFRVPKQNRHPPLTDAAGEAGFGNWRAFRP